MKRWSVKDVMTRDVVTVTEETPYKEIVEKLVARSVSALPVLGPDGRVVGVVSEADLLHKLQLCGLAGHIWLLENKRSRQAKTKAAADTARELMTSPAVTIGPDEPLPAAAQLMESRRFKRLPVVDQGGHLVGIVSRSDLVRVYLRSDEEIRNEILDHVLLRTMWIDPDTVEVNINRGIVTLEGTLDQRSAVPLVVRLCREVRGVVDVVDHLSFRFDDVANARRAYQPGPRVRTGIR